MYSKTIVAFMLLGIISATLIQEQSLLDNRRIGNANLLQLKDDESTECVEADGCLSNVSVKVVCKGGTCTVEDNSDTTDFELTVELTATEETSSCETSGSESESRWM